MRAFNVFKCVTSSSSPRIWLSTHTCLLVIPISQEMRQGTCHRPPWAGCHKSLGCDMRPSEVWWQSPESHHVGGGAGGRFGLKQVCDTKERASTEKKKREKVSFRNDVVYDGTRLISSMGVSSASTSSWKFPWAPPHVESACDFCVGIWILIQHCHNEIPKYYCSILSAQRLMKIVQGKWVKGKSEANQVSLSGNSSTTSPWSWKRYQLGVKGARWFGCSSCSTHVWGT